MFDTINGIPIHPLVVHAVVVLLPLSVLGTLAIVFRPAWRRKYGHLVLASSLVATALCPVATSSGEALEKRVGDPGQHAALGDQLVWFALALLVSVVLLLVADRRPGVGRAVARTAVVLAAMAALATSVQVYRVGDSGARAAWGDAGSQ